MPEDKLSTYLPKQNLFSSSYFERVLGDPKLGILRELPDDGADSLKRLVELWDRERNRFIISDRPAQGELLPLAPYRGLPEGFKPLANDSESNIENGFIRPVVESILGFFVVQNRSLRLSEGVADEVKSPNQRPDLVLFSDKAVCDRAVKDAGGPKSVPDGVAFCRGAQMIVDAKRFDKGVGEDDPANEGKRLKKKHRQDTTAIEDLKQVERYLRGYQKKWGVLTNGRVWRLMRQGQVHECVQFNLVLFLEDLRGRKITGQDLSIFKLFWNLFGIPAVAGGVLDKIERESEADTSKVRDILRDQAHKAVETIANGFWGHTSNGYPKAPTQGELDHLRELSLTFLYRLLFILKAEAQNLLPVFDELGAETTYTKYLSTRAIFKHLREMGATERERVSVLFNALYRLFDAIDRGDRTTEIPAYNGGLFNPDRHRELNKLVLDDETLYVILRTLIYQQDDLDSPVPYADLNVRDLGDIYEGLLEQRLTLEQDANGQPFLRLANQKGERKASGSYYTPDSLVDHLVRKAVTPLLETTGNDPWKLLDIKLLDPAMGSGHFLVKAVDVIAEYLTQHCDPVDEGAPDNDGPEEMAYWKRKVAENCIYGVDYNPMSVELAKVALWLYTAEKDKPLSFLDHHLKCGNSLIGIDLDQLGTVPLVLKVLKSGGKWEPKIKKKKAAGQSEMGIRIGEKMIGNVRSAMTEVMSTPSDTPEDIKRKSQVYSKEVEQRLAAHKLLADLWCAQFFFVEPTEEDANDHDRLMGTVRRICSIEDDAARAAELETILQHPLVERIYKAKDEGYGPRPTRFFHWQLEFPEVAFDEAGKCRSGFGFDAVVGNPPWDKIKPAKRDFYSPFSEEVAGTQGASLNRLIMKLEEEKPELEDGWRHYEDTLKRIVAFLSESGFYEHQVTKVNGKKTGGDPDLFRYFVERASQCATDGGRVGYLVPCTLWQAESTTALRRMLFGAYTMESLYTFENYRKWAFYIHSSFKFTAIVFNKARPPKNHEFPAAFMLRDPSALVGKQPERMLSLCRDFVEQTSPDTLALLDIKSDGERKVIEKLHGQEHLKPLGDPANGWDVKYARELDMTNDSWLFKSRDWMERRGFTQVLPVRGEDGSWTQERKGPGSVAGVPDQLPPGGEYWVAAGANYYEGRGYEKRDGTVSGEPKTWFLHPEDLTLVNQKGSRFSEDHFRIFPGAHYTALYEGRMVHNFEHAQKAYVGGEGRKAIWKDIELDDKRLASRVFVTLEETGEPGPYRLGFCDVTGATNERTTLAAIVPSTSAAGNKVPTFTTPDLRSSIMVTAILNSFVWDALIRLRISTTMNYIYLKQIPVPSRSMLNDEMIEQITERVLRLSCTTPELAPYWNEVFPDDPWSYDSAERDPWERAKLRAELDAIVAEAYGLSVPEYARILTTFPLLDRNFESLPGDLFLTEGDDGTPEDRKIEAPDGVWDAKPRSFITRDFALLTYIRRQKQPIPERLDDWFRDEVGLDPEGPLSRFRIGEVKDLEARVEEAKRQGAVPYVPTSRG